MLPFELTKDTPYLALSGELWSVFYEYFNRNWSCYKGFLLYMRQWTGSSLVQRQVITWSNAGLFIIFIQENAIENDYQNGSRFVHREMS